MSTVDPSLSNHDLRPTTPAQRTWTMYNYIALWFSMSMEITTYQLASSLIAKGMDWKQAVGTVLLGNLIVLVPMLLNAHAGAKYGIPFPGLHSRAVRRARRKPARAFCAPSLPAAGSAFSPGSAAPPSTPCSPSSGPRRREQPGVALGLLPRLLAPEHGGRLARRRIHPPPASLRRALHVRHGRGAAHLGTHQGGQLRHHALHAQPIPLHRRIPRRLLPVAHGDGRLLGHARAQHPRLHALLQIADTRKPGARHSGCPSP